MLVCCEWLLPLQAQRVPVVETNLANGLRLLLVQRHDEPTVAAGWVARAGSANERQGMTRIAHLFKHMMFKGTETMGTTNFPMDEQIILSQEKVREAMRGHLCADWRVSGAGRQNQPSRIDRVFAR